MLRPTTEEVLLSISRDFDTDIRPDPASPLAFSLALTTSNLLRHVRLRVEHEEGLIQTDLHELRTVLSDAAEFMAGSADDRLAERGRAIAETLAVPLPAALPPAHAARERWTALRWLLGDTIDALIEARDRYRDSAAYPAVRADIRAYLDRSLMRETVLITEAFTVARR